MTIDWQSQVQQIPRQLQGNVKAQPEFQPFEDPIGKVFWHEKGDRAHLKNLADVLKDSKLL